MESTDTGSVENLRQPFIDMASESWRFGKLFNRVLDKLEPSEAARYANQLRYFLKRLDDSLKLAGLWIVSLEGQAYDAGMAASPLNMEDFDPNDILFVEQMVEPVLMGPDGLVKPGTVLLKRVS
ncbi:MAG: hypothetical protein ACOYMG_22765 [Candidatus Methylumidiphilus sp.]